MDVRYAFIGIFGIAVLLAINAKFMSEQTDQPKDTLRKNITKSLEKNSSAIPGMGMANQAPKGLAVPSVETATNPVPQASNTNALDATTSPMGAFPPAGMQQPSITGANISGSPSATMNGTLPPPSAPPASAFPGLETPIRTIAPYTPPAPATATAPPSANDPMAGLTLNNGQRVMFYGERVYTTTSDGQQIQPIPDGSYTLKNGQALIVREGKRQMTAY